jgi:hypothetical protein
MRSSTAGAGIVLAFSLSLVAAPAVANTEQPVIVIDRDADSPFGAYLRAEVELFDTLRNDASPRRQVLAARLYVDDEGVPAALRPKREDVAANAALRARNDPVVQWIAADSGSYDPSQCGPTRWPDAEVAALVGMEPDNAGALQYAVALAHAKDDPSALDEALARMAAATRADDHYGDEVAEWRRALGAHPDRSAFGALWEGASAEERALLGALQRADSASAPADDALESACTPDGDVERAWQRLDRCVDAGTLLAAKGSRFALRETGLKMLAAAGAAPGDLAELQRQLDWLEAHAANPLSHAAASRDALSDLMADWRGAPSEITATERRLQRLGLPVQAPPGWIQADSKNDVADPAEDPAWRKYVRALLDDMRGSTDVHTQVLALASHKLFTGGLANDGSADAQAAEEAPAPDALAALVAANPDDLLVQWVAATSGNDAAIANVQRLDADNAAAWGLSLSAADADADALALLQRMAAAKRYDEHFADLLAPWLAAVRKRPIPVEEIPAALMSSPSAENFSAETAGKVAALNFAAVSSTSASHFAAVYTACKKRGEANDQPHADACVAIGRLMLNSSYTVVSALIGRAILRQAGPLAADDEQRARRIDWWQESQTSLLSGAAGIDAYVEDLASTGSEIEAQRLAATRAGKADPPVDWTSPAEIRAARKP